MRKILKKTATLMMTAVIGVSMSCPKMIVYAGQRMQMQERYTTPKEWNYTEITAYQFAIRSIPSFLAVADRQYFAFAVEPVFSPVAHWYCFSSLLVDESVNGVLPRAVVWVISSIQIPVY